MRVSQAARLSEAAYLVLERGAASKSEFHDGAMFAMAGGSPRHSLIAGNLNRALGNGPAGRGCYTFTSDLRVKVEMTGSYTYSDVSVVGGELRFADPEQDPLVNPTLLAEVLSDATEAYDRGEKFEHYRRIPSLQACLLASQHQPVLERCLWGTASQWTVHEALGTEASLEVSPLRIALPLSEIYAPVTFPPATLRPTPGGSS